MPISPNELAETQIKNIPAKVFEAFDTLIARNYHGGYATVLQDDVVEIIMAKMNIGRLEIFSKGYLNVEKAYQKMGWKVTYDKPAYYENYSASFKFKG